MTKANLFPGLLGKVLKRGTRVLRLAHAKVKNNNNNNRINYFAYKLSVFNHHFQLFWQ